MRRLSPTLFFRCVMAAVIAMPWPALAQVALQPLQAIRDAAVAALQAPPGSQAMVAPGLRLTACAQPLTATPAGAATAEVRCPDAPGWRLFVPVRGPRATRPQPAVATADAGAPHRLAAPEGEAPAVTIKRGDPVVLRAAVGGTEVRMGGRALGAAVAGGTVNVENETSHRIVRGRLAPDGTVEVAN